MITANKTIETFLITGSIVIAALWALFIGLGSGGFIDYEWAVETVTYLSIAVVCVFWMVFRIRKGPTKPEPSKHPPAHYLRCDNCAGLFPSNYYLESIAGKGNLCAECRKAFAGA